MWSFEITDNMIMVNIYVNIMFWSIAGTFHLKKTNDICLFPTFSFQAKYDSGEIIFIPHVKFGFILLAILFMSLFVFGLCKFKLNKYLGVIFVLFYIGFVGYAYVQDLHCDGDCW